MELPTSEKTSNNKIKKLCTSLLASRKFLFIIFVLAIIITLPSIKSGIMMDDYHMKALMLDPGNPHNFMTSPLNIFEFFDGDPARSQELIDYGWIPWWITDLSLKASFWRPLSAMTHWLDYLIFSFNPVAMHIPSILWYAGLSILVAVYYRRIMGPVAVAGLAALMWVLDDAHGTPVGFITNRNALITCFFCVLTLIAHDKWYKEKQLKWGITAIISLAMSLLAKEAGIATLAYLFAYIVILESGTWKNKLIRFMPYIIVAAVWRSLWIILGHGIKNVGMYVDPIAEPMRFFSEMWGKMVLLLSAQLAGIPADITIA